MRSLTTVALWLIAAPALAEGPSPALPADYRDWTNYYNNDRWKVEGQHIRCYANDLAIAGAQAGGPLPEGAVVIGELWTVLKEGDSVPLSLLDARIVDAHAATLVMERVDGADAAYGDGIESGDWAYSVYNADGTPRGDGDVTACRECHAPQGERQYLFTYEHLAKRIVE